METKSSLWKSPVELIHSVGQAMQGKISSINMLKQMEAEKAPIEPDLKSLHAEVKDTRELMFSENKWLCRWLHELVMALETIHMPKHGEAHSLLERPSPEDIAKLAGSVS